VVSQLDVIDLMVRHADSLVGPTDHGGSCPSSRSPHVKSLVSAVRPQLNDVTTWYTALNSMMSPRDIPSLRSF